MSWKDLLKRTLKGKKRQMTYAEEQIAGENTVKPNPMVIQVIPQEDPPLPFSRVHADATCRDEKGLEILFTDPQTGNQKMIVNKYGYFVDFPGIDIMGDREVDLLSTTTSVELGVDFSFFGSDKYLVVWQVQMSDCPLKMGEDSNGFSDEDVYLYSLMDQKGDFLFPFRFYQVGMKKIFWQQPSIRLRKRPNTQFVQEDRFVEWAETEANLNDPNPILRIPMPRVYTYESEKGFYVDGKVYQSVQDFKSRKDRKEHIYWDIYNRKVMEVYERFPCFDSYDYANEDRYYRWFYLVSGNKMWCIYQADGRKTVLVTEDVAEIDAMVWRNMKRFHLVEDAELYSFVL